ncbi:MAG: 50S ribosome-binding GTPase, partial [Eggerthellaceae bacterium]|nr:50S ribosome-binding GTPase [Eggerthellaceae bacterium]
MNYHNASFKAAYGTSAQLPASALPEVAFSGRSNVGKSSLLNKLMYRKSLAKVSATPGKTATINFYDLDGAADFVDLPGYG